MSIQTLMQKRFACKTFDSTKKISDQDLQEILEVGRLSPSSYGLQAWKFLVISNQDVKTKLAPACWNQVQITEAPVVMILLARTDLDGENGAINEYIEQYKKDFNKTDADVAAFKGFVMGVLKRTPDEQRNWVQKQLYLAGMAMMIAATEKGIDSCPMEGFMDTEVSKVLNLPANFVPSLIIPFGYGKMEQPKKSRFPMEKVVEFVK